MADEIKEEESGIEIVTAEKVLPHYYKEGLLQADYELTRLNMPSGRVYFLHDGERYHLFSGTGSIDKELPMDENLIKVIAKRGFEEADRHKYLRMLLGSFEHTCIADFANGIPLNFDLIPDMLKEYYYNQSFYITDKEHKDMSREVQKDMIGFLQWLKDYEVELVGVEYPLFSYELQMASQADILCFMTIREGNVKQKTYRERRVFGIGDWKSGKWGHSIGHRYQLYSLQTMFRERFPSLAETEVTLFNLTGKNFRGTKWDRKTFPYKLTDQTDKADIIDYNHTLAKATNRLEQRVNKKFMYITGKMDLSSNPADYIIQKSIKDLILDGDWKRFEKTAAGIPSSLTA